MREKQRGVAAVLVAIFLPVIIGGLGLVIDNGTAYDIKRQLQQVADSAAMAAIQEVRRGNTSGYVAAAEYAAEQNGFDSGSGTLNIERPPSSGTHAGDANFLRVTVRGEAPIFFMRPFVEGPLHVEAMAEAGVVAPRVCFYVMDDSASGAFRSVGNASLDIGNCGLQINSSSRNAATKSGNSDVSASFINVVGDYNGPGWSPTPTSGAPALDDPFEHIANPAVGACQHNNVRVRGTQTLQPGTYCGGIRIDGTANFASGNYIIRGGLENRGTANGTNVFFYMTANADGSYSGVDFLSNSRARLSAATGGTYGGILFFEDRSITRSVTNKLGGNSGTSLTGALYFPRSDLDLGGTGDLVLSEFTVVANKVSLVGNSTVSVTGPQQNSVYVNDALLAGTLVY